MILAFGVSHKTAPIEIREKLAFSKEHVPDALKSLASDARLNEVALLSTCNRTEFYCSAVVCDPAVQHDLSNWWQRHLAPAFDMKPYLYTYSDRMAANHIMRVASGLDSMVLGEPQILGQLKAAYRTASEVGVVGQRLARLFQSSFSVAKQVRRNTGIALHPVSIAYAAVSLAKQIFTDLSQAKVLLIGAGENIELTLQHLVSKGVQHFTIVNRTLAHAQKLATQFGGECLALSQLTQGLRTADIVISAIDISKPIVGPLQIEQALAGEKRRPLLMIDLGVPRNIDACLAENEDIYLYSVDDLQNIVTENLKSRQTAAQAAEYLIAQASADYMDWISAHAHKPALWALRNKAANIKEEVLKDALNRLQNGKDPQAVVTQLAHQLTQKLMHNPTLSLRKLCAENAQEKIVLIKEVFSIE